MPLEVKEVRQQRNQMKPSEASEQDLLSLSLVWQIAKCLRITPGKHDVWCVRMNQRQRAARILSGIGQMMKFSLHVGTSQDWSE